MTNTDNSDPQRVTQRYAATGILFAGLSAFAIGKLVHTRLRKSDREWVEIEIS